MKTDKLLPYYRVGWVHTATGDHYAGALVRADFCGNELFVVFNLMATVKEGGDPPTWHAVGKLRADYPFSFAGCVTLENGGDRVKVRSREGDIVFLSRAENDRAQVRTIVQEGLDRLSNQ